MKALVVGASSGVGRALAEGLAAEGKDLFLVASDPRDLAALAAHLRLKFGVRVDTAACHIRWDDAGWLSALSERMGEPEGFDALFLPIGSSREDDTGGMAEGAMRQLVEVNFFSVASLVSYFLPTFTRRGTGRIVAFGSVAAARGRSANVVYAASKRALTSYFESLSHLMAGTAVNIQCYQLGYVDTQQSYGKRLLFPKITPRRAVEIVLGGSRRGSGVRYLPGFWRPIVWLVRSLPWAIYKGLRF